MDRGHLRIMQELCPPAHQGKLRLFMENQDVPDPYYGDLEGFDEVYDLCLQGCEELLHSVRSE